MRTMGCYYYLNVVYLLVILCIFVQRTHCQNELSYTINEEEPSPYEVCNVYEDSPTLQNTPVEQLTFRFGIIGDGSSSNNDLFSMSDTGVISTTTELDRDVLCPEDATCSMQLMVIIGPIYDMIPVTITVSDINDNMPEFPYNSIDIEIPEDSDPGNLQDLPLASDLDYGRFGIQSYAIIDNTLFDVSEAVSADGTKKLELHLMGVLDREQRSSYLVTVNAYDGDGAVSMGTMSINITVTDANDNDPTFDELVYTVAVGENTDIDETLVTVHADDLDIGRNGVVQYAFLPNTQENFGSVFTIDSTSGDIVLRQELDYESRDSYQLGVVAFDDGDPRRSSEATVYINVQDINDNPPRITVNTLQPTEYAQVSEGADVGAFVAHITATDEDSGNGGVVVCEMIEHDVFELERYFGQYKVVTKRTLNRETQETYEVTLVCRDSGVPERTTMHDLTVKVIDENDNAPVFEQRQFAIEVQENNIPSASLFTITATDRDADANGELTYIITSGGEWFDVDPVMGEVRARAILDHEQQSVIDLRVMAVDNGSPPLNDTVLIDVIIIDINDEVPMFANQSYWMRITEEVEPEVLIGYVHATDADSPPYNVVNYKLSHEDSYKPFRIHNTTGAIYSTAKLDADLDVTHTLTVVANNPGFIGLMNSARVTIEVIDINDNRPIISYPNTENTTVFVSSNVEVGEPIYQIVATDLDHGLNAQLSYFLVTGNEQSYFTVNDFGMISAAEPLTEFFHQNFTLGILVRDHGSISLDDRAQLHVMVRQIDSDPSAVAAGSTSTKNKVIVIAILTASAIIVLLLITAIAFIKYLSKRRHTTVEDNKPPQSYYETGRQNDSSSKQLCHDHTQLPNMDDSLPTTERNYIFSDYSFPSRATDSISGYNQTRSDLYSNVHRGSPLHLTDNGSTIDSGHSSLRPGVPLSIPTSGPRTASPAASRQENYATLGTLGNLDTFRQLNPSNLGDTISMPQRSYLQQRSSPMYSQHQKLYERPRHNSVDNYYLPRTLSDRNKSSLARTDKVSPLAYSQSFSTAPKKENVPQPGMDFHPGSYQTMGVYPAMISHTPNLDPKYIHGLPTTMLGPHSEALSEIKSSCSEEEASNTDSGRGLSDGDSFTSPMSKDLSMPSDGARPFQDIEMQEQHRPETPSRTHHRVQTNNNNNTNNPCPIDGSTGTISTMASTGDITNDDDMSSMSGSYIIDPDFSNHLPNIHCVYNSDTDV